ncbi:MAG: hypothetical protein JWQ75_2150 [Pseudarthrobacter sp.]|nr:hypothetical protein [Pseudarthrobacter sp.]
MVKAPPSAAPSASPSASPHVPKVSVASNIYAAQGREYEDPDDGWQTSPFFLVQSDQTDRAAAALYRTINRCMWVGTSGRELTEEEASTGEEYTANYGSPIYLTDAGPMAYLDTKGEWPRAMAETMVRILIEEVTAEGIDAYLTTPFWGNQHTKEWPVWEPRSP